MEVDSACEILLTKLQCVFNVFVFSMKLVAHNLSPVKLSDENKSAACLLGTKSNMYYSGRYSIHKLLG
jgi:hypothetical protein